MPHPGWASTAEHDWLESNRTKFGDAQRKGTISGWFPLKYTEYFDKFPMTPDKDAIAAAGSREAAMNDLQNKRKSVGDQSLRSLIGHLPGLAANLLVVL